MALTEDAEARKLALLREINQRNFGYFEQEVEKLDAWADDLKLGLEQEIKAIDVEIREVRRTAATSPTLEEKLAHQKRQRELEGKRSKLRREAMIIVWAIAAVAWMERSLRSNPGSSWPKR